MIQWWSDFSTTIGFDTRIVRIVHNYSSIWANLGVPPWYPHDLVTTLSRHLVDTSFRAFGTIATFEERFPHDASLAVEGRHQVPRCREPRLDPVRGCWALIQCRNCIIFEGSLEVKLPTIWRDEKQSREEAERRERLEERRSEEKESEERRCRCAKR